MTFISYDTLKTTPNDIHFAIAPIDWANKIVNFGYYAELKEANFYAVVNSSPEAFDTGEWAKTHPSGEERFYLKSGAYFKIYYQGRDNLYFGIFDKNDTTLFNANINGKNGSSGINHAGILTLYVDSDNKKACMGYLRDVRTLGTSSWSGSQYMVKFNNENPYTQEEMTTLYNTIFSSLPPEYPWKEEGTEAGGGEGIWDDNNTDPISSPSDTDLNTNTIGKTFFATTYKVSFTELKGIAEKLWSTDFLDWVKQYFSNPLEGIINLSMIPVSYVSDSYHSVIIGNYNTNRVGNIVQSQYKTVDCGYIDIPEKWGGAIDYKSRITLYLPFIGSHDLDAIEIIGGRLSVSYIVDLVTGACVAFVKVKRGDLESVLYQFTGNCAYSMPVTQNSYNSLLSSMLSASAAVAVGVATGGASTPLMVGAGASVASDARPHVAHSGNLAGNAGYMGIKKPYVILSRPRQSLPQNFGKYIGYQSHITKRLGDCKGFTQVEYIHVDGISNATSEELQEIENLLKSGVIIA